MMKSCILFGKKMLCQGLPLLFFLTGVYGLLLLFQSAQEMNLEWRTVYLYGALPCIFLWIMSRLKLRFLYYGILFLPPALGLFFLIFRPEAYGQVQEAVRQLAGISETPDVSVTVGMLLLIWGISWLMYLMEFILYVHWLLCVLLTGLLLAAPALGILPGPAGVLCLCVFQIVFWIFPNPFGQKRTGPAEWKRNVSMAAGRGAAITAGAAAVFLLSWVLVNNHSQWFYQTAYRIEGTVRRTAQQLNGQTDSFSDGVISRGNIYPSGNVQMELWADQLPEETLYLRNFSGGSYENGRWLAAEEEDLFLRMAETLHWEQWSDWIPNMYNVLYFLMNLYSGGSETEAHMMQIRYLSEDGQENPYFPYYSRVSQWHGREEGNMSTVWYFNQDEMNIRWDQVPDTFSATSDWYYAIQETYLQEAQSVYTELPEGELPRLTELCRENPQEDLNHITAFILYTLQSQASYTRTPGLYPVNQDPTEYFLFESGEGYCQHFASAAALMYRLYGIPARYAAGYAVSPSDFEQQENGRYYAAVTDESAHAWVEIFLEDLGWTPVEVTPPANNAQISYPMMTQEELEDILGNQSWNLEIFQALPREQEAEEERTGIDFSLFSDGVSRFLSGAEAGKLLRGMFLAAAVFALAWQDQHRKRERREIPELFARLVKALHFAGYLREYTGTERNFPAQLKQLFPELPERQTEEAVRIAWKAAFGENPLFPGEEKEFRDYYIRAAEELGGRQNPLRRLILRYGIMGVRLLCG